MQKPRIYIDGFNLSLEQGTGVATYSRNLSFALRDLGAEVGVLYGTTTSTISMYSLIREIAFFDLRVGKPSWLLERLVNLWRAARLPFGEIATQVPMTGRVIRDTYQSRLPYFDHIWNVQDLFNKQSLYGSFFGRRLNIHFRHAPEIMHWTYPLALRVLKAKNIYTMHDLVPLRLPYTTLDNKRYYFRLIRRLTRSADHIVTVSEASKKDIMNLFGVPERRITNTYQAVDIPARYRNKPISDVKSDVEGTFGLNYKNYFLFFGAIEPKKNVGRMIEAYLASGVADPLVIVGKKAWKSEEELRLISDNEHVRYLLTNGNITERRFRILQVDYASFPLLVSLIRGAKAVLFPSLYEGFGLPALEAMSLGTPVLTSNTASMPEVVGSAALQVDPYDTRALVEGIRALDSDGDLRGRLAEAGPIQAQNFSPERYQARLAQVYGKFTKMPD
ncbi:MAG: glycosyltransferase family 4 protein [Acetobacteraceae bacterium]|nr:glycosyltransferase family 1 protein [Acetobacteraceae bacterium]